MGLVAKTESSEYGLFASGGIPEFAVHLDRRYAIAKNADFRLEPGRWHHVAGVFDGSEVRLYVDGARIARAPASGRRTIRAVPLIVGADVDGAGRPSSPFRGDMDEVRLSSVARYAGAAIDPPRRVEPDGETVLLLHLDRAIGPWTFDAGPGERHPTVVGEPRVVPVN